MNCALRTCSPDEREYLGEDALTATSSVTCAECRKEIEAGARYVSHRWQCGGEEARADVCLVCEELRGVICAPLGKLHEVIGQKAITWEFSLETPGLEQSLTPEAWKELVSIVDCAHLRTLAAEEMRKGKSRADVSALVIRCVIARIGTADEHRLRAELRRAYPFGARTSHPHRVWRKTIRNILGPAPVQGKRG